MARREVKMTPTGGQWDTAPSVTTLDGCYRFIWGLTERDEATGDWVVRREIRDALELLQVRPDGAADTPDPLYVGFTCQDCWESAIELVVYRHHLCGRAPGPPGREATG